MIPGSALRRFWPLLLAVVLIIVLLLLVRCADRAQDGAVTQGREAGIAQERADTATETLNRTVEAIHAEDAIRRDPDVRDAACLRHSRTPQDC